MAEYAALISKAVPFLLVLFRIAGMFIFAPLLSSSVMPRKIKALMVMMMAAALFPMVPLPALNVESLDMVTLTPMLAAEAVIGLAMGVISTIPLISLEMAGVIMGQQMGFGLARVYNPELEFDADLMGQLFFYIGAGAFMAMGGLETLFITLADTFTRVPVGLGAARDVPVDLILNVLSSGFQLAMRVAAPVGCMMFLLDIAFGVMAKTMPQLNVMSVGFTVKILAGLGIGAFSIYSIGSVAGDELQGTLRIVMDWASHLGTPESFVASPGP